MELFLSELSEVQLDWILLHLQGRRSASSAEVPFFKLGRLVQSLLDATPPSASCVSMEPTYQFAALSLSTSGPHWHVCMLGENIRDDDNERAAKSIQNHNTAKKQLRYIQEQSQMQASILHSSSPGRFHQQNRQSLPSMNIVECSKQTFLNKAVSVTQPKDPTNRKPKTHRSYRCHSLPLRSFSTLVVAHFLIFTASSPL